MILLDRWLTPEQRREFREALATKQRFDDRFKAPTLFDLCRAADDQGLELAHAR